MRTLPNIDANNALILGTAMHEGIQHGIEAAIKFYYSIPPIIDDTYVDEAIKLEYLIPKVQEILPNGEYEIRVATFDFIGFADLVTENEDGTYDIYDFKYSNNLQNYRESRQLHLYKYFFEKQYQKRVQNLNFVFIPKVGIKQKKDETLYEFRQRLLQELEVSKIQIVPVEFDLEKVIEFYEGIKAMSETKNFPKEPNQFCYWCEYQEFCEKGVDYMLLPKNERRDIRKVNKKTIWIYGVPFSGKTTFANQFPDPLILNTDGGVKFVDAPYIPIRDEVTVEGRQTKRKFAWEVFKDIIDELEKKDNDFKTIVVDLLEDVYEYCRLYMYDKLGISHESDESFSAWDKVRIEFLSTLKRLMNLDYENIILISHEDRTKDITRKGGDKVTAIKPNLTDKVATKVAGMVDIVARVVADGDERILSFKTSEVIFGGGRFKVAREIVPLDYQEFLKVYKEANEATIVTPDIAEEVKPLITEEKPLVTEEKPVTKTRKRRGE